MWFSLVYIFRNRNLRKHYWGLSRDIIKVGVKACASNIILKIHYKSFSIYLAIDKVAERAFGARIGWSKKYWRLGKLIKVTKRKSRLRSSGAGQSGGSTTINFIRASIIFKSYFENSLATKYNLKAMRYPNKLVFPLGIE